MSSLRALGCAAAAVAASACGAASKLDPAGPRAQRIADLTWLMTGLAAAVFLIVMIAVGGIVLRAMRDVRLPRMSDTAMILAGGIILPALILPVVWFATLRDMRALVEPPQEPALVVEIEGRQFAYVVRYPDHGVTVADEIHIPVGRTVLVRVMSKDVIHSFWVPRLMGKIDMIPGRVNEQWIEASRPGSYLVECAEFCGLHHADMKMMLVAEPAETFERWLAANRR